MAAERKLKGEIDRTLKKVTEGQEQFDELWEQVHSCDNSNQREKFEGELKKEIKKLQRLREQIKAWITNADIKDKQPLMDARKSIERDMERFKVCEREMKMAGRAGAPRAADPKEKAKEEARDWVNGAVEGINSKVESFEYEMEELAANVKKKQKPPPRLLELEELVAKLKEHEAKLEKIMRCIDNETILPDELEGLKESMDMYLNGEEEDNGIDISSIEELYEEFTDRLEAVDLAVPAAAAGHGHGKHVKSKDKDKDKEEAEKEREREKEGERQRAAAAAAKAQLKAQGNNNVVQLSYEDDDRGKAGARAAVAASTPAAVQLLGVQPPPPPPAARMAASPTGKDAHADGVAGAAAATAAPPPPSTPRTAAPATAAATPAAGILSSPGAVRTAAATPAPTTPTPAAAATPAGAWGGAAGAAVAAATPPPAAAAEQQQPIAASLTTATSLGQKGAAAVGKAAAAAAAAAPAAATAAPPPGITAPVAKAPVGAAQAAAGTARTAGPPPGYAAGAAQAKADGAGAAPKAEADGASRLDISSSSDGLAAAVKALALDGGQDGTGKSAAHAQQQPLEPLNLQPAVPVYSTAAAKQILESCYVRAQPQTSDIDWRAYRPRHPVPVPASYPRVPHEVTENPGLFRKMDPECLFFAFYFQPDSYQQFLAAHELKRQSWRFHKHHNAWFQRFTEPSITSDEFEQGAYVYFDYNIQHEDNQAGWCYRRKENFTFRYDALEDELRTPGATTAVAAQS